MSTIYKKLLFTVAFLISCYVCNGQSATNAIVGRVVNENGKSISSISVLIRSNNRGVITDPEGRFTIDNLKPGSYIILVTGIGYESKTVTTEVPGIPLTIKLKATTKSLDEVKVAGKTKSREIKESGYNVSAIETRRFANTTYDLNQVLNQSTGVKIREEGGLGSNFNFTLNGLSGSAIKFFIDGVPMETFGGSLTLNNFPVNLVERIDVYKGVVPVSLGSDALGGAVNIVTNKKVNKYLDASLSYGSYNTQRFSLSGLYKSASGLVFKANGFYNYSDNDYIMRNNPDAGVVIQVIENGEFVARDSRRFHDRYRSGMAQFETGFVNKPWADYLLVGLTASGNYKEIQTARSVDVVIGQAKQTSNYLMPSLKYKKDNFLIKNLSLNAFASYGVDKYLLTDTSSQLYGWSGQTRVTSGVTGELGQGAKSLFHYTNKSALMRYNATYQIDAQNSLDLNYNFIKDQRAGYNELDKNAFGNIFDKPNKINKNIIGIAYQNFLFDGKLISSPFVKYYGYGSSTQTTGYDNSTNSYYKIPLEGHNHYYGYGIAERYKITDAIGIKFSYEKAVRLPEGGEIFGDGLFLLPNPQLKPELSKNINAGFFVFKQFAKHRYSIEGSYFTRHAGNYITQLIIGSGRTSQYTNIPGVKINGVEGEFNYEYNNLFTLAVNGSYFNAVDDKAFITAQDITIPNNTYLNKIPNQPYLYGNADIGIGKNDIGGKGTRLQFNWTTQYVHEFDLSWSAFGSKESHAIIPTQIIHNASIAYSRQNGRYNVSIECRNLTNELAYDNFRLQKPQRMFYAKIRYFIN